MDTCLEPDARNHLLCREAAKAARLGFGGFILAVLGRGRSFERRDEPGGNGSDFVYRVLERGFVGFRRLGESADLTDELERGSADLGFGYRRVEVEQRPDIAAHGVKVAENTARGRFWTARVAVETGSPLAQATAPPAEYPDSSYG